MGLRITAKERGYLVKVHMQLTFLGDLPGTWLPNKDVRENQVEEIAHK